VDCERLDSLAIDLIDLTQPGGSTELDPRAQREAEEHLAACARCTSALERLRSGMRAASQLGLEDPSSLLEARILAAAGAVKPEVPVSRRISRAISTIGSWAMRPQVAMAAVLVVMVGTSIVLLRGGGLPGAHRTKVTEEGTPVATLEPAAPAVEGQGAPAVIGGGESKDDKQKPKENAKAESAPLDLPKAEKKADDMKPMEEAEAPTTKSLAKKGPVKDLAADEDGNAYGATGGLGAKGGGGMVAPAQPAPPPPAGGYAPPADFGDKEASKKTTTAAPAPGPAPTTTPTPASYDDAMAAYKEAKYAVAAKGFDAAAAAGQRPSSSLLYAARSYRAVGSYALALPRFQKVVNSYPTSPEAPHAALEGGQCAKAMGDTTTARALFEKAKTYPATQKQAENELAALDKPPSASPPAKAKATSKPSAVDNGY